GLGEARTQVHLRRAARVRRPTRGERGEQRGPHSLTPSPHPSFPLSTSRRGGRGARPHGETLSVVRTRALAESAARIALPTPLAPGIRDCARIESRWRSVSESPPAADLAVLPPEHAARSARTMVSTRARIGSPIGPAVICRDAACCAPTLPEPAS